MEKSKFVVNTRAENLPSGKLAKVYRTLVSKVNLGGSL